MTARENLLAAAKAARAGDVERARAHARAAVDAASSAEELEIELGLRLHAQLAQLITVLVVIEGRAL